MVISQLLEVVGQSLNLDSQLWQHLATHSQALHYRLAFLIVLAAGFSEAIAQSVVLFLNQVPPRRFLLSLCVNAVIFCCGFGFYMLSIDLIATQLFRATTPPTLFVGLSLAYAPLTLSFVTMIPYLGQGLHIYLQIYHFLALTVATSVLYTLSFNQAMLSVIAGSIVLYLARISIGKPLLRFMRYSRNLSAGKPLQNIEQWYAQWQHNLLGTPEEKSMEGDNT